MGSRFQSCAEHAGRNRVIKDHISSPVRMFGALSAAQTRWSGLEPCCRECENGKKVFFGQKCEKCHGSQGQGEHIYNLDGRGRKSRYQILAGFGFSSIL